MTEKVVNGGPDQEDSGLGKCRRITVCKRYERVHICGERREVAKVLEELDAPIDDLNLENEDNDDEPEFCRLRSCENDVDSEDVEIKED